jgi:tryptophan synthase alpha chain
MNPIDKAFQKDRPLLVAYLTAGDPTPQDSSILFQALVDGGADILEIGVPFSDPGADGPAIQRASERALASGATLKSALAIAAELPKDHPKVLFGYLNPFLAFGYEALAEACLDSGIHGVLCVDCPPEEENDFRDHLEQRGIHSILLAAPTTPTDRIELLSNSGGGFLYYVSMTGVTGGEVSNHGGLETRLQEVRKSSSLPVAVGFGIRSPENVRDLAPHVDAVVVGSALVRLVEAHGVRASEPLQELTESLASALSDAPQ